MSTYHVIQIVESVILHFLHALQVLPHFPLPGLQPIIGPLHDLDKVKELVELGEVNRDKPFPQISSSLAVCRRSRSLEQIICLKVIAYEPINGNCLRY